MTTGTATRPADNASAWREIRSSRGFAFRWRELWEYRQLGAMLALRDLQLRYRQTKLGVTWAVLQPALAMLVFSLLLGDLAGLPSDGLPYPVFVLAGLVIWFYISNAVSAAAESLVEYRELVTKVWFPRLLAPLAAVSAALVDLAIGVVLLIPVMAIADVAPPPQMVLLPLWVLAAWVTALGIGTLLSAVNVLYRDVRYALSFILQIWFFVSPVVFPTSLVEGGWKFLFFLNPVAGIIDGVRWSLLAAPAPGPEILVSLASLLTLLVGGAAYFASAQRTFADRI